MTTKGIEGVYLETHNWGKSAKFLKLLGFEVEFATEDGSGVLRNGDGPYVVLSEVPESQQPQVEVILTGADVDAFAAEASLDVVQPFTATHYGTRELKVRDPEGRLWSVQAPPA